MKLRDYLVPISLVSLIAIVLMIWQSFHRFVVNTPAHDVCPRMIPNYFLWLSLLLMVLVIVPLSYHVISKRLEDKMEKNLEAITRMVDSKASAGGDHQLTSRIMKLLNPSEKKIVERLSENGSCLQSEISRMEGMTKLKAHRAVKELERKGIVKLEQYGKTKKLILKKEMKDVLSH